MNQFSKIAVGTWIQAVGTVISAIGNTPSIKVDQEILEDLILWGEVLQATGNALIAEGQDDFSLDAVGNGIQSMGNVTEIAGIVIDSDEDTVLKLIISGNWLQALGSLVSFSYEYVMKSNAHQVYSIIGNLIQAIGNSMQALSGVYQLNTMDNPFSVQTLDVVGSWIQAMGSIISVIGQVLEETEETKLGIDE